MKKSIINNVNFTSCLSAGYIGLTHKMEETVVKDVCQTTLAYDGSHIRLMVRMGKVIISVDLNSDHVLLFKEAIKVMENENNNK